MKAVRIIWRDAHRYTYQMEDDRDVEVTEITTVGQLVRKTKKDVVVCQDDIRGDLRGVMAIPRENIISIKYL